MSSLESGAPEYRVVIDKDRAAVMGLSVTSVASAINNLVDGVTPVTYWLDGNELSVNVQLRESDRDSLPDLNSLFIITSSGRKIPIANLASFELTAGPEDIDRENEKRILHVTADVASGTTATQVMAEVESFLNNSYVVPDGVELSFGGRVEGDRENRRSVGSDYCSRGHYGFCRNGEPL